MKKTPLYPNPSPSSLPDVVDGPFGKSILPARPVLEVRRTEVFCPRAVFRLWQETLSVLPTSLHSNDVFYATGRVPSPP